MSAFSACGFFPILLCNGRSIGSMQNSYGGVILLRTVNAVRKVIVGDDAIKLGCWLIVICRPVDTRVVTNLCSSIVGNDHPLIILRSDPQIVMIAVWCIERLICFTTVF